MPLRRARGPVTTRLAAALLALGLTGPATCAWAQTTGGAEGGTITRNLTPDEAQLLARQALDQGRPDIAAEVARQIVASMPMDPSGWMLLAAAEAQLGHGKASAKAGRQAFRLADGDGPARFEAAYLTALGYSVQDAPLKAKFWLRRASDYAPDAASTSTVAQGFRQLSARTPWRFGINAAAGPSANVNGGSRHDTILIFGLPFTIPEALPGAIWNLGGEAGYRLKQTDRSLTEAFAKASHQGVWLSSEARALAPDVTSRDFALTQVEAGLSHRWQPGEPPLVLGVTGSLGRNWYGGGALSDLLRLSGQAIWGQGAGSIWSAGLATELSWNAQRSDRDSNTAQISIGWQKTLTKAGTVSVTLGLRDVWSPAADINHKAALVRLGFAPKANPEGLDALFSLGVEARDYRRVPQLGTDLKLDAAATVTFNQVDYMGFSPNVRLAAERTKSDFLPRDTSDLSIGLGFSSKF